MLAGFENKISYFILLLNPIQPKNLTRPPKEKTQTKNKNIQTPLICSNRKSYNKISYYTTVSKDSLQLFQIFASIWKDLLCLYTKLNSDWNASVDFYSCFLPVLLGKGEILCNASS